MKPYLLQLVQALSLQDHILCTQFCANFQKRLQENGLAEKVIFSDEAIFRVFGKMNRHNVRVWGTQNAYKFVEHFCYVINRFCWKFVSMCASFELAILLL